LVDEIKVSENKVALIVLAGTIAGAAAVKTLNNAFSLVFVEVATNKQNMLEVTPMIKLTAMTGRV